MTNKENELLIEDVLELGKRYVLTGAEVKRVEESIRRIFIAYGFENVEIYAVTSLVLVSVKSPDGTHYTQSVRVNSGGTDLGRLEELNAQIRDICANTPDVYELDKQVKGYEKPKPKPILKCLGYMLAAGGFAVFFGGNALDGVASALIGIAIYFMDYHFKIRSLNNVIYSILASFVSGCLAIVMVHFGIGHNVDKVMIGDIMLFIPGLMMVNAIKEIFNRDIYTGLHRFVEAVFIAVAIAGGFALAIVVLGGVL